MHKYKLNPDLYKPTKKDWAFPPQITCPDAENWWYYDAVFDNGYCINTAWRCSDKAAQVVSEIADAEGKLYGTRVHFPRSTVKASTEYLDVTMGENRIWGEFPNYYSRFHSPQVGENLVWEATMQEFREPPDGCYIGRLNPAASPVYFTFMTRPRVKVSGTIEVNGEKIPVTGIGYNDHQYSNIPWPKYLNWYVYSKVHLPNHTIAYWDATLSPDFGCQRMKWLHLFKGDALIHYTNQARAYTEESEFEVMGEQGTAFPKKVTVYFDDPWIQGTLTYKMKWDLILMPRGWADFPYRRHLQECHTDVVIDGERVVEDTLEVQEIVTRN